MVIIWSKEVKIKVLLERKMGKKTTWNTVFPFCDLKYKATNNFLNTL